MRYGLYALSDLKTSGEILLEISSFQILESMPTIS